MKKFTAFSLLMSALLSLTQLKAQDGKIFGKVKGNDSLIIGATVTLRSLHDSVLIKGTATNDSGKYELNNLDTGHYILNISYVGYLPFAKEIRITENNKVVANEVVMSYRFIISPPYSLNTADFQAPVLQTSKIHLR